MRVLISLLLIFSIFSSVYSSARVILPTKKELRISAETDFDRSEYSWVLLSKDGYILDNQNGTVYIQKFTKEGKYDLNLTITDKESGETKFTSTEVIVGTPNKYFDNFKPVLEIEPAIDLDGEIPFEKYKGEVTLFLGNSVGIKSFSIDKDLLEDSDEDGDKENDKDNEECSSISKCPSYSFPVESDSISLKKAKITFYGHDGQKEEQVLKIAFNKKIAKKSAKLKADLRSLPRYNSESKEIYVPYGVQEILLYSKYSQGDFLEYRIDEDIQIDSDGDGKSSNDTDNKNHQSFKDGSVYRIVKGKKDEQIVQLLVVSGGKGSLVRRKVVWGKKNDNLNLSLFTSTTEAFVGKKVYFGISGEGVEDYAIEWDFDGDGDIDKKNKQNTYFEYDEVGSYALNVKIKDKETGKIVKEHDIKINVSEEVETEFKSKKPVVDFSFDINGPIVNFNQDIIVDERLLDNSYDSYWKFGNGNISTDENPQFIYSNIGEYEVELLVTDSVGKTTLVTKNINITKQSLDSPFDDDKVFSTGVVADNTGSDLEPDDQPVDVELETPEDETEEPVEDRDSESSGILTKIFYFIFLLIILFSGFVIAYLVFQKIKHPDYTFGEILEEERERLLSMIEGEPYIPHEEKEIIDDIKGNLGDILPEKEEPKKEEKETEKKIEPKKEAAKISPVAQEKPSIFDSKAKEENKSDDKPIVAKPDQGKGDKKIPSWLMGNDAKSEKSEPKKEKPVLDQSISNITNKKASKNTSKKPVVAKSDKIFSEKKNTKPSAASSQVKTPAWLQGDKAAKVEQKNNKPVGAKIFDKKPEQKPDSNLVKKPQAPAQNSNKKKADFNFPPPPPPPLVKTKSSNTAKVSNIKTDNDIVSSLEAANKDSKKPKTDDKKEDKKNDVEIPDWLK